MRRCRLRDVLFTRVIIGEPGYNDELDNVAFAPLPHHIYAQSEELPAPALSAASSVRAKVAKFTVANLRRTFDAVTRYRPQQFPLKSWLVRILFLEAVAGVPGAVAGYQLHMKSLRDARPTNGRINELLGEAENERVHLLTTLKLLKPSIFLKFGIFVTHYMFTCAYTMLYKISPRSAHEFVGHMEDQAVKTYSAFLAAHERGELPELRELAPQHAAGYWGLSKTATLKDIFTAIRNDEVHHSCFNHALATQ